MVKLTYGIAGFATGLMAGLLVAVVEMKLLRGPGHADILPFVIGVTVFSCIIAGVSMGIKMAKRKIN